MSLILCALAWLISDTAMVLKSGASQSITSKVKTVIDREHTHAQQSTLSAPGRKNRVLMILICALLSMITGANPMFIPLLVTLTECTGDLSHDLKRIAGWTILGLLGNLIFVAIVMYVMTRNHSLAVAPR